MNQGKIIWVFFVSCLVVLLLVFGDEIFGRGYLVKQSFDLPANGRAIHTTKPLDPSQVYTIEISSRYNLRELKQVQLRKLKPESEIFGPGGVELEKAKKKLEQENQNFENKRREIQAHKQELAGKKEILEVLERKGQENERKAQSLRGTTSYWDVLGESVEINEEIENTKKEIKELEVKIRAFGIPKQVFEIKRQELEKEKQKLRLTQDSDALLELSQKQEELLNEVKNLESQREGVESAEQDLQEKIERFKKEKVEFEALKKQNSNWQIDSRSFSPPAIFETISKEGTTLYTNIRQGSHDFRDLFDRLEASAVLFDEQPLQVKFTYPEKEWADYLDTLGFSLRGQGRPLTLRLAGDFSKQISWAKVTISSPRWQWKRKVAAGGVGLVLLSLLLPTWRERRKLSKERKMLARLQIQEELRLHHEWEKEERRIRAEIEEEETRKRQEREKEEERQRKERYAKEAQNRCEQNLFFAVRNWRYRVELEPNFFDPEYRKNLAKTKRNEILNELKEEWFQEYRQVMYNKELLTRLEQEAPRVLEWLNLRNQAVFEAERLAVTKHKPNPEEWREKQLWWERIKAEDELAKLSVVGKSKELKFEFKNQKFKEIDLREDLEDYQKDELKQLWQDITGLEDKDNGDGKEPQIL